MMLGLTSYALAYMGSSALPLSHRASAVAMQAKLESPIPGMARPSYLDGSLAVSSKALATASQSIPGHVLPAALPHALTHIIAA
jgi:hypothetical protein